MLVGGVTAGQLASSLRGGAQHAAAPSLHSHHAVSLKNTSPQPLAPPAVDAPRPWCPAFFPGCCSSSCVRRRQEEAAWGQTHSRSLPTPTFYGWEESLINSSPQTNRQATG
eukprot:GHVT01001716.1.p1 GENE.GHVT01001716.1~~GHVT01001716.1.p1  ORF type:complete len:111 (+),score=23.07 GHVT01001716.1:448-780(+)